jgi:anti-anti-sigma factor
MDRGFSPRTKGQDMLGTCKPVGEVDRASAPAFGDLIYDAIDRSDDALVDCSLVTFVDCVGCRVFVDQSH